MSCIEITCFIVIYLTIGIAINAFWHGYTGNRADGDQFLTVLFWPIDIIVVLFVWLGKTLKEWNK